MIKIIKQIYTNKILKDAFLKALSATLLFWLSYHFYNYEIVRSDMEDIAFDTINKFVIQNHEANLSKPKVLEFVFDDLYMHEHKLYDSKGRKAFGYLFPRDHIADFINDLDEFCTEAEKGNCPKALFIDYDFSFTMLPYGKELSKEDKKLLKTLSRERPYIILLPKTGYYNFIENSPDKVLRKAIAEHRITFVDTSLLRSYDGDVRRYKSYEEYEELNGTKALYPNISVALWYLIHDRPLVNKNIVKTFFKEDIIANRIWIKRFNKEINISTDCWIRHSLWGALDKYSANCSLYDLVEDDFAGSIVMLGATYRDNEDLFSVLDVMGADKLSGIDLHANALMTIWHLKGQLHRLPLTESLLIVFVAFFFVSFFVSMLFKRFNIDSHEVEFFVLLGLATIVLIGISVFFLIEEHFWFNWFVPLVLFEIVEIFDYFKEIYPIIIQKIRRNK